MINELWLWEQFYFICSWGCWMLFCVQLGMQTSKWEILWITRLLLIVFRTVSTEPRSPVFSPDLHCLIFWLVAFFYSENSFKWAFTSFSFEDSNFVCSWELEYFQTVILEFPTDLESPFYNERQVTWICGLLLMVTFSKSVLLLNELWAQCYCKNSFKYAFTLVALEDSYFVCIWECQLQSVEDYVSLLLVAFT